MAGKAPKRPANEPPGGAYLLALLLCGAQDEAATALQTACKAGVTEATFAGKTAAAVWRLALHGVVGAELREACFAAGLPIDGLLAASESAEYGGRSNGTALRWAEGAVAGATARRVAELGRVLAENPTNDAVAKAVPELLRLQDGHAAGASDLYSPEECAAAFAHSLERLEADRAAGRLVRTGYPALDSLMGPLAAGGITVVAARTSVGKSKFALNVLHNNASQGTVCHMYSMEQGKEQVFGRLWSIDTGMAVPESLQGAIGKNLAYGGPLYVCDTPRLSAGDIAARVRHAAKRPRLLCVDYLGLMRHPESHQSTEAWGIGETVKDLRAHGKELGYHTLLLVQVNRAGAEEKPQLHHLRGSGDIEQDADYALLLAAGEPLAGTPTLWVEVAKNRVTGRCGRVRLRNAGASCRMEAA